MYPDTTDDEAFAQGRPRHMVSAEQLRGWTAQADPLKPQTQSRANAGRRKTGGGGSKASKSEGDDSDGPSSRPRLQRHKSMTAQLRLEEGICEEESDAEEREDKRRASLRLGSLVVGTMLALSAVLWLGAIGGAMDPQTSAQPSSRPRQRVLHLELAGASEVRSRFVLDTDHDWESFEQGCKERLNIEGISRVTLASSGEDILSARP